MRAQQFQASGASAGACTFVINNGNNTRYPVPAIFFSNSRIGWPDCATPLTFRFKRAEMARKLQ